MLLEFVALLEAGVETGAIEKDELDVLAASLGRLGYKVAAPRALLRRGQGSLVLKLKRCGNAACACRADPAARHGPYVVHRYREDGKARERSLGRFDDPSTHRKVAALGFPLPPALAAGGEASAAAWEKHVGAFLVE